jgi:PAS domain S-box-containing protein
MKDTDKTKVQLIEELGALRQRVAELEAAEATHKQAEASYQTIIHTTIVGFWIVDMQGRILDLNKAYCNLIGYSRDELLNMTISDVEAAEKPEQIASHTQKLKEAGNDRFESRHRRKDGKIIDVEVNTNYLPIEDGRMFVFFRDITERKQMEERLRESEQRFRLLAENAKDMIFRLQVWPERKFEYVSPSATAVTGYTPEERYIDPLLVLKIIHPEDRAILEAMIEKPESFSTPVAMRWIRKDGIVIWVEIQNTFFYDEEGRFVAIEGIVRDITDRKNLEEMLRESEERYRAIFEQATESIILTDSDTLAVVDFNNSAHQNLGYSRKEFAKLKVSDFEAIESAEEVMKHRKSTLEKGSEIFETKHRTKSGEIRDVQVSTRTIRIGGRDFAIGISHDITERKKADEELRKFKTISEAAGYGIVIGNTDGIFEYVNQAFAIMHGYSVEELLGKHFSAMHTAEQMKRVEELHNQLSHKGDYIGEEVWHRRKDGTVFLALMNATAIRDDNGNPLYFAVTSIDITERKKAEEELKLRSELLDSATDSIFVHDIEGNFIYVNETACKAHGYSREALMNLRLQDVVAHDHLEADNQNILEKGRTAFESAHRRKDGSVIPVEIHGRTIELGDRKLFLTVVRDITERKKVEEERRQLEQKSQLASRLASVGELASGVAHEINNPLTGVIGYAHLLLTRKDIPQDIKHDIKVINEGAQRVANIVRKLLAFARHTKPERREVDINEIIGMTLDLRAYELASNNIRVTQRLAQDLPMTVADPGQLQQVFLNLIINAETEMKLAHGGGKLLIETKQVNNTIRISFRDNGPGIAKKNLEKIFDPFFTTREVGEGTGLGLSLCHGIIAEHKGKIYAESKPGKGATFTVELPITTKDRQLEMPEPTVEEPQNTTKAKILVVDDELMIRQFVSQVLSEEGHDVEVVDKAEDALEKIKNKRYRLILLDIKMPGMSGIELYKQLQKMAPSLVKRVVFITGDILGTQTIDFLARTKVPCIMKPFEAEQLKTKIDRILAKNM